MMYWMLLIGCLFLFAFAWWMEGGRWAAPSVIVSFCLALVSAMSILGRGRWNSVVLDLQGGTVGAIFVGCAAFIVGCLFVNLVFDGRRASQTEVISFERSSLSTDKLIALALIGIAGTALWYLIVGRNLGTFNPVTLSTALKNGSGDVEPTIATGFRCLTYASCALGCAVAGLAVARSEKHIVLLASAVALCSVVPSAVSAIRTNVLHLVVGALVAFSMGCKICGRGSGLKFKKLLLVFFGVYVLVQLFYLAVQFSGRSSYYDSPLDYIEFYLAGSVPALDGFIRSIGAPTGISETFSGLQDLAHRFGFIDTVSLKASNHWAVVNYSYDGVTNIFTFIRPALHDFGFGGLVLYMIALGIFFQLLYRKAVDRGSIVSFVVYSYLSYILVESMRDDFFSYWFGLEGLVTLFLLLLFNSWVFAGGEKELYERRENASITTRNKASENTFQLDGGHGL